MGDSKGAFPDPETGEEIESTRSSRLTGALFLGFGILTAAYVLWAPMDPAFRRLWRRWLGDLDGAKGYLPWLCHGIFACAFLVYSVRCSRSQEAAMAYWQHYRRTRPRDGSAEPTFSDAGTGEEIQSTMLARVAGHVALRLECALLACLPGWLVIFAPENWLSFTARAVLATVVLFGTFFGLVHLRRKAIFASSYEIPEGRTARWVHHAVARWQHKRKRQSGQ